jgi:hypothetical protein
MILDPMNNITEHNESNNENLFSVEIRQMPTNASIFTDDYNITNWTQIDNSSIIDSVFPFIGEKCWITDPNHQGIANLTLSGLYFNYEFNNNTNAYLNFSSNHSLVSPGNQGFIFLKYADNATPIELMNFSGISGNGEDPEWEIISVNLTDYFKIGNASCSDSTIIFSVTLNGTSDIFWHIDNITINSWGIYCGIDEDETLQGGSSLSYLNWEYIQCVDKTGTFWQHTTKDEIDCWWNGNSTLNTYENSVDNIFRSPGISLANFEGEEYHLNFTHQYSFSDTDYLEFFIINNSLSNGKVFDTFSGVQPEWKTLSYNISEYKGQIIYLCFRMASNSIGTSSGYYLDPIDIRLAKGGALLAYHGIENICPSENMYLLNYDNIDLEPRNSDTVEQNYNYHFWLFHENDNPNRFFQSKIRSWTYQRTLNNYALITAIDLTTSLKPPGAIDTYEITVELKDEYYAYSDVLKTPMNGQRVAQFTYEDDSITSTEAQTQTIGFWTYAVLPNKDSSYSELFWYFKYHVKFTRQTYDLIGGGRFRVGDPRETRVDVMEYVIPITYQVDEITPSYWQTVCRIQVTRPLNAPPMEATAWSSQFDGDILFLDPCSTVKYQHELRIYEDGNEEDDLKSVYHITRRVDWYYSASWVHEKGRTSTHIFRDTQANPQSHTRIEKIHWSTRAPDTMYLGEMSLLKVEFTFSVDIYDSNGQKEYGPNTYGITPTYSIMVWSGEWLRTGDPYIENINNRDKLPYFVYWEPKNYP